jgi:hypothetical protein
MGASFTATSNRGPVTDIFHFSFKRLAFITCTILNYVYTVIMPVPDLILMDLNSGFGWQDLAGKLRPHNTWRQATPSTLDDGIDEPSPYHVHCTCGHGDHFPGSF